MWLSTGVAAAGVVIALTLIHSPREEHPPVQEELAEASGTPLAEVAAVQADG